MPRRDLSFFDEKRAVHKARTEWGCWWQTVQEVHIQVNLPEGVKSKEIKVEVKPKYISVVVQGRTIFEGTLPRTVYAEETVWTLEDGVLCILLAKADYTVREEIWESLLINGVFRPDAWTLHGMRKDFDLERFQIENPGMDFSRAKLAKNYDRLPGWSAQRLAELRRRNEGQPPRTQASSTQTLSDLRKNEACDKAQGSAPMVPATGSQSFVDTRSEGCIKIPGLLPRTPVTATQTLADLKRIREEMNRVQGQVPKTPAPATQTLADLKKSGEGFGSGQGQIPKTPATATQTLADLKKSGEGIGRGQEQVRQMPATSTQTLADVLKKIQEGGDKEQGKVPKTQATATQTSADLNKPTEEGGDEEQAPKTQATATQTLSDLKKKCKERRDKEEQDPKTEGTESPTSGDMKKKKTEESDDKLQE